MICGSSVKLSLLKDSEEDDGDSEETKIDFSSASFEDDTLAKLESSLASTDTLSLITVAKEIYDYRVLVNLLKGEQYLSNAMVNIYEEHHKQLKQLKLLFKKYNKKEYANFFRKLRSDKDNSIITYSDYVGFLKKNKKKSHSKHSVSLDDLYKEIRKQLPIDDQKRTITNWKDAEDERICCEINQLMDAGKYLTRQNSKDNGVFPYQLNMMEMRQIIENQKQYYPFLAEKDISFVNEEKEDYKLVSLLQFRIPYFVGPLSDKTGDESSLKNHWVCRKIPDEKITPWNFHAVIDEEESSKYFIDHLKNQCTYLIGEKTLPKQSLLYSKFEVLNEMNNWLINGERIKLEDKNYLFNKVYLKLKKPGIKAIKAALKEKYKDEVQLYTRTGKELMAEDIHASLSSWIDMMDENLFGNRILSSNEAFEKAEETIETITVFEDKKNRIKQFKKLGFNESQIKGLLRLNYSGWGRLSKKFLTGVTTELVNTDTGEALDYSIIQLMEERPLNFIEIYETEGEGSFDFKKQIEALNNQEKPTVNDLIENSYTSPNMKRALRQTMRIVNELKQILHIENFDSYFIECTRSSDEKQKGNRKNSRKQQLLEYYKTAKDFVDTEVKERLIKMDDEALRRKRVFLYFAQLGKSVYSGEPIDFESLDSEYDVDHIIPQSRLKDDSFTNTVLVEQGLNRNKTDIYPIPSGIVSQKGKEWIQYLHSIGKNHELMPKEKMDRILRPSAKVWTEEEQIGFINRQLVVTNQAVKAVADVIRAAEPKAKVVFSKANLVSDFRKEFNLVKCRDVNDFHHANDAYLNIVVGNTYSKLFSSYLNKKDFEQKNEFNESLNAGVEYVFRHDVRRNNTLIWKSKHYVNKVEDKDSQGTLDLVRKTLSWNDPMVTWMLYTQTGQQGYFNKISIRTAEDESAVFPLKNKVPFNSDGWEGKYGGYNDLTASSFMLVKSKDKKKWQYSLENIPAINLASMNTKEEKEQYLCEKCKLIEPSILIDKILIRTIVEIPNGDFVSKLAISGRSGNAMLSINASELMVSNEWQSYIKNISRILGTNAPASQKVDLSKYENIRKGSIKNITFEKNIELFDYLRNVFVSRKSFASIPEVSNVFNSLDSVRSVFCDLSTIEQMKVLISLIELVSCKSIQGVNLSKIGLGKSLGMKRFNKKLVPGTKLIQTSATGFYKKVLFEVPKE